jgi:hypothetical protein
MRCQSKGGLSATTKVKVLSPEILLFALGQGFHFLEASTGLRDKGECITGVPGSKSVAGRPTVHIGTWENHIVPDGSLQQAEEARRRYGGMVVGLIHSRGVAGVMPGEPPKARALEGISSKTQRDEVAYAIH